MSDLSERSHQAYSATQPRLSCLTQTETSTKMAKDVAFFSLAHANAGLNFEQIVHRVLESQSFILGAEVTQFEAEFAAYCGSSHAIGVGNGTDALELSLRALGMGPNKKVVTVANAGFYASAAILAVGATPVYVDIATDGRLICPEALDEKLSHTPCDCVIVTHLYGELADMNRISQIGRKHSVPVVEDCAQAHGAQAWGKKAGAWGDIGCFSFYPTKNLGAVGDGGALTTSDPLLAERLRQLRQYGWGVKYDVQLEGGRNSRLDELQAAILRYKLGYLDEANASRRAIALQYNEAFASLPVQTPFIREAGHVCHLYTLQVAKRDGFRAHLTQSGISSAVHYPIADYSQKIMSPHAEHALPHTQAHVESTVSLPCYPNMPQSDVQRTIDATRSFFVREALDA